MAHDLLDFRNKAVLITGAGIGRAVGGGLRQPWSASIVHES